MEMVQCLTQRNLPLKVVLSEKEGTYREINEYSFLDLTFSQNQSRRVDDLRSDLRGRKTETEEPGQSSVENWSQRSRHFSNPTPFTIVSRKSGF